MATVGDLTVDELKDKTVLITGGARRLGKAIVLAMAEKKANVVFTYLHSADQATEILGQIESAGAPGLAIECDVRQPESVEKTVGMVLDRFGTIDLLVNNAGVFYTSKLEEITPEQWDEVFDVNVRAPFLFSQRSIPALRSALGRIINLGSLGAQRPWATHAHYCSSKAALHMLTQVMAKALAPHIAVNCVAPGMIDSEEGPREISTLDRFAAKTPMGRNGSPQDVVNAVMYLATASHFITGQILTVDGGLGLA
jgi:NAD(P)-dependent dehydrogenase (short-subunit alcohol dehydrogenase family)